MPDPARATAPPRTSAGLLLHRAGPHGPEVLLAHMGGPFWTRRPRAWTVPKGEPLPGEHPHATALREFAEEVGVAAPSGPDGEDDVDLGEVRQRAGKVVRVWARAADLDLDVPRGPVSEVSVEWPRGSGRTLTFPEVDALRWVPLTDAEPLVVQAQAAFLDRLAAHLGAPPAS